MPILMYHHIAECPSESSAHAGLWVSPELFEEQLRWLRARGYVGLTVHQLALALRGEADLPRRWVVITFDDGWRDNYTHAWPLLREYGFPATIYVSTGRLRDSETQGKPDEMMSAEEFRELARAGIEIGAHTRTHPKLTRLSDGEARGEIVGSRDDLAQILGEPPASFSYPYGAFSPRIERIVREAGFLSAVSTIRDNQVRPSQLYHLPRVMVMRSTTLDRYRYMFSWWYHLVHAWKNRFRWQGCA